MDTARPRSALLSQPRSNLGYSAKILPRLECGAQGERAHLMKEAASGVWDPVQRGAHHLVESGVQPKGGSPKSQ
jgi:hypothetical protein